MEIKTGQTVKIKIKGIEVEGIVTYLDVDCYVVIYDDNQLIEFETIKIYGV